MEKCLYCFNDADPNNPSGLCADHIANPDIDAWTDDVPLEDDDRDSFTWTIESSVDLFHKLADNDKCECGEMLLPVEGANGVLQGEWRPEINTEADLDKLLPHHKNSDNFDWENYTTKMPGNPKKYKLSNILQLAEIYLNSLKS